MTPAQRQAALRACADVFVVALGGGLVLLLLLALLLAAHPWLALALLLSALGAGAVLVPPWLLRWELRQAADREQRQLTAALLASRDPAERERLLALLRLGGLPEAGDWSLGATLKALLDD